MSINATYYAAQITAINACKDCASLNRLSTQYLDAINTVIGSMNSQISLLTALNVVPGANFTDIINWITNFNSTFSAALTILTADFAALTTQLSTLTAAINAKKALLGC
jgi:hypothetical protein